MELGRGVVDEMEPLLMMRPPRGDWAFMVLKACWMHKNMPVRLMSTTFCHCSSVQSSNEPGGLPTPALLNSTSTRPKALTAAAKSACTDSTFDTSVGTAKAFAPAPDCVMTSCSGSTRRPARTTL